IRQARPDVDTCTMADRIDRDDDPTGEPSVLPRPRPQLLGILDQHAHTMPIRSGPSTLNEEPVILEGSAFDLSGLSTLNSQLSTTRSHDHRGDRVGRMLPPL